MQTSPPERLLHVKYIRALDLVLRPAWVYLGLGVLSGWDAAHAHFHIVTSPAFSEEDELRMALDVYFQGSGLPGSFSVEVAQSAPGQPQGDWVCGG